MLTVYDQRPLANSEVKVFIQVTLPNIGSHIDTSKRHVSYPTLLFKLHASIVLLIIYRMHVWLAHIAWSASLGLTCIGWQSTGEGKDEKETLRVVLNVNWQVPHLAKMETTYTCSVSECENYIQWNTWSEIGDTSIIVDERFNYLIEELSKLASRFFSFQTQEQILRQRKRSAPLGGPCMEPSDRPNYGGRLAIVCKMQKLHAADHSNFYLRTS